MAYSNQEKAQIFEPYTQTNATLQNNKTVAVIFDLNGIFFGAQPCNPFLSQAKTIGPINSGRTLRLLYDCRNAGHTLYAVSNLSRNGYEFLLNDPQSATILNSFDDVILAEDAGYKKPDPRIFDYLLIKHHLNPRLCIFIDDEQRNLEGAAKAGIAKLILCSNFDINAVRTELELWGIL